MTPEELRAGKARVLDNLIRPLDDVMRYRRPKGVALWQHVAGLGELQARLAYLGADDLAALREAVVAQTGPDGQWPRPAVILGWAKMLRLPEPSDSPKVTSWMASAAGRRAMAEGVHGALYRWLKVNRGVPGPMDMRAIRAQAEDDARFRDRMLDLKARGVALSSGEAARLDRIEASERRAAALIPEAGDGGEDAA